VSGISVQSGSARITAANTSEIVSPPNAFRPASISNSTHPKAQMSVRPPIHPLPLRLLRAHVGCRPQDHSRLRGHRAQRGGVRQIHRGGGILCVQHLHHAFGRDLHVCRLQVTMNHAAFVRVFQRVGNLSGDRQSLSRRGVPCVLTLNI